MNEPDYDYVYNQLRKVKNDVSFREEVAEHNIPFMRSIYNNSAQGCTACIFYYIQSPFYRWQQKDRTSCNADILRA